MLKLDAVVGLRGTVEPVICIDEKSAELLARSRAPLLIAQGAPIKEDYEYVRRGTSNLFVAIEPKGGHREVSVTQHRGKSDFVHFIAALLTGTYAAARRVHLVLDNLNIHLRKCFVDILGQPAAGKLLGRVEFHYTPKHASWLNMAEIEIGVLKGQCLNRRIADRERLEREIAAWQRGRNAAEAKIEWMFTTEAARTKLGRFYPHPPVADLPGKLS